MVIYNIEEGSPSDVGQINLIDIAADDGATPLFLAAQEGHANCCKLLLDNGAQANLSTIDPVALPLHAALQFSHNE